jgi:hypothetical protein
MSTKSRARRRPKTAPPRQLVPWTGPPALPQRDLRNRGPFITDIQIRAAFAARLAGVSYTRITGWLRQADGTVRYAMPSGAALTYDPAADTPLTAWTPCAAAVRHPHPITTPADLLDAQHEVLTCTEHGTPTVITLHDALTTDPFSEDTVQTDVTALRAAQDDDTAKEHPEP